MRGQISFLFLAALISVGCTDAADPVDDSHLGVEVEMCMGSVDQEIILSRRDEDGGVTADTVRFFEDCARTDCFAEVFEDDTAALEACMHECIDQSEVLDLSHGCRDCYVEEVACAIQNCLLPCSGTDSSLCDACVDDICNERLVDCVGY